MLLRWLRLPLWRGLHLLLLLLLLLLLRRSGLAARGELGKFVIVIIVTFEASTRLEFALTLQRVLRTSGATSSSDSALSSLLSLSTPPLAGGDSPPSWTDELEFSSSAGGSHPSTT